MLVAVDTGNTHTVIGLFEGDRLLADWRTATRSDATDDEVAALWRSLFDARGLAVASVEGVIVSSVVPDWNGVLADASRKAFGKTALFVEPGVKTGLPIRYENPHEVGADRIVNAVSAAERFGSPVLVLDFGTATTFDVVSAKREYLGGIIAPGLAISAEALFRRAARLSRVDIRKPAHLVGRNTQESVQAGLFYGYVGLVEGLVRRLRHEVGEQAPVVATGGLAQVFRDELPFLTAVDPHLTLEGLRLIWEKNKR